MSGFRARKLNGKWAVVKDDGTIVERGFCNHTSAWARVRALSPKKKVAARRCITCRTPFASEGAHNRMCPRCRSGHDPLAWMSG